MLGEEDDMAMQKKFGKSLEFIKSAYQIVLGSIKGDKGGLWSSIEAANQAAGCSYEYGTCWGTKVCQIGFFVLNFFQKIRIDFINTFFFWLKIS